MSKLLAIVAGMKAALIAVSGAFARGDMPLVILISVLFEIGAKPVGQTETREPIGVSRGCDDRR